MVRSGSRPKWPRTIRLPWRQPIPSLCLYTAIYGEREKGIHDGWQQLGIPVFCFSNQTNLHLPGATLRPAPALFPDPNRSAKVFKILPHLYLPEFSISIWFDANMVPKTTDLRSEALRALTGSDLALYAHPERDCIYDEANVCLNSKRDSASVLCAQVAHYRAKGVPQHCGLFSAGFLMRRHGTHLMRQMAFRWWKEIGTFSRRDQVSLPVVLRELNISPTVLAGTVRKNDLFMLVPHAGAELRISDARVSTAA